MTLRTVPQDQEILDQFFSLSARPSLEKVAWLFGMVAVYGKTPEELEHFTWNDDYTINLQCKKRSVRPLHPQWVFLFQLKEKQPSKLKSCWNKILKGLSKEQDAGLVLPIEDVLLAHKVRKLYYTPTKRHAPSGFQKKQSRLLCSV
jgi:hypothetical protein